ncbi:hypothetical protein NO976_04414 (plasmid) [Planktothrix agardhii]|jgi:hypothetical protein|uniref:hypothetical protein n=1 Tax=Planktothrix agardhii TaxID=1160 RepID=UPI001F2EEF0E|nr:hypothetical protein [Planktothrix agardhii]MCF3609783.1 hypothetical protein [Planktothrix agardhii 1033]CAD5984334.1 hypothetical protein NO976_04414 [Planktothrix agardhii]
MALSIDEIYDQIIDNFLPAERLRLATLILNNLVEQNAGVIDKGHTWTEEDISDLTDFSLQYAATAYNHNEELAE